MGVEVALQRHPGRGAVAARHRRASSIRRSSLAASTAKARMPSASFSVAIASSFSAQRKAFSSWCTAGRSSARARVGVQCARQRRVAGLQRGQQLGADGQQVAAGQRGDLADVAEAGAHHLGGDAVALVVVVDGGAPTVHAGVVGAGVRGFVPGGAGALLVPVVDAADEGRDQLHAGVAAGHGLREAEQQRQVAVDAFAFQHLGGADAFPGGGDLDQHALAADARGFVQRR